MTGSVIPVLRSRCAHNPRTRLHTFLCLRGGPKYLPRRRSAGRHVATLHSAIRACATPHPPAHPQRAQV
jgi:hypothetical protein